MEGTRFLMVSYYVIGAVSLESAILGQYAEYLRTLRPDIPPAERQACGTDDVPEPGRCVPLRADPARNAGRRGTRTAPTRPWARFRHFDRMLAGAFGILG
jgi:hypothetical protein